MTPAELAVERDRLLEGGRTLEEVERMQDAADSLLLLRVAVSTRELLVAALRRLQRYPPHTYDPGLEMAADTIGHVDLTKLVDSFTYPNKSPAPK